VEGGGGKEKEKRKKDFRIERNSGPLPCCERCAAWLSGSFFGCFLETKRREKKEKMRKG
jgi:hypothetical protein